ERSALASAFGVDRACVTVIPNGVDTARFRNLGQAREAGLLLAVGRVAAVKQLDLAIEALALLRAKHLDFRLAIAGEDWGDGARLRQLADRLGVGAYVGLIGRVAEDELVDLYNRAELLVAPSRYEAFGIVALEAAACGCPSVVSANGGLREAGGPAS